VAVPGTRPGREIADYLGSIAGGKSQTLPGGA